MPPKSTYFFPKPLSGSSSIRSIDDAWLETCRSASRTSAACSRSCRPRSSASRSCGAARGRRDDRDRPGAEDAVVARLAARRRGLRPRLGGARYARRSAPEGAPSRRRPDRRLGEREGGIPFFSLLARRRRGLDDGRRRSATSTTSARRGVDGRARSRRVPRRSTAGRRARRTTIEILSFEGTTTRAIADRSAASPMSPAASGSWARSRCRSATSRRPRRRGGVSQGGTLRGHRGRAAPASASAARDRAVRGSALRAAPLDLGMRSRLAAARARRSSCAGSQRRCTR
jgi:hypothetical protein